MKPKEVRCNEGCSGNVQVNGKERNPLYKFDKMAEAGLQEWQISGEVREERKNFHLNSVISKETSKGGERD